MIMVDGEYKNGVKKRCVECGVEFEVKKYNENRRKLCGILQF